MADYEKYHIYCDESATTQHRYTVIGLIFCAENVAAPFSKWLDKIAASYSVSSELKWTKLKNHRLSLYKDYSSAFFKARRKGYAKFHAIIIDNSAMNHKLFNDGDKEIGFNKMLFHLLFGMIRQYRSRPKFYAYLDNRVTKHTPENLRKMLNARAVSEFGITHRPYRVCQFRDSSEVRLIQLTDIICGAIHYAINEQHQSVGAAAYKIDLMNHITKEAGVATLAIPTTFANDGFDLWHIDLNSYAKGVQRS